MAIPGAEHRALDKNHRGLVHTRHDWTFRIHVDHRDSQKNRKEIPRQRLSF